MTKYIGIVRDNLNTLDDRLTKIHGSYKEAHDAAEKLCKRTLGDRGSIDVMEVWKVERDFTVKKCLFDDIFEETVTELAERAEAGMIPTWESYDVAKIENTYPVKNYHLNLCEGPVENPGNVVATAYIHTVAGEDTAKVTVAW